MLSAWILSFCIKNVLSPTWRPKNFAYVAFKGIKVDISLYQTCQITNPQLLTAGITTQQMERPVNHIGWAGCSAAEQVSEIQNEKKKRFSLFLTFCEEVTETLINCSQP